MRNDIRQAVRRLRHQPVFALGVVAVLSLAITAVAVVVAIAGAVVLSPLPYASPDRIAVIWEWETERSNRNLLEVSYRTYLDWRAQSRSFEDLAVMGSVNWSHRLTGLGDPSDIPNAAVSASFFNVMGVAPARGRVLRTSDDQPNAAPVVVLSFGFWQRRLGGVPDVIGRTLTLDDRSFEIVGVMPQAFDFPRGAETWTALVPELTAVSQQYEVNALEDRWFGILFAVGRLHPSIGIDRARQELDEINKGIDTLVGERPAHAVVVTSLEERLLGRTRPALLLLLGAVVLMLCIATANIATLFLMRAAATQRETAVRIAVGASSRRLFRLWLAEAMILFGSAAVLGIIEAAAFLPLAVRLASDSVYRIGDAHVTMVVVLSVLAMTAVAAVAASLLVTLLSTARVRLLEALKEAAHVASIRRLAIARRTLVTAEFAVALLLLVLAGLTIRSFINLRELELGFDPRGVLTLDVAPSRRFEGRANRDFYTPLVARLAALPQVAAAGAIYQRPLAHEGVGMDTGVLPEGYAPEDIAAWISAGIRANREAITPGYFSAMRIPVREGRDFSEQDAERAEPVAILGESAARSLFGGRSALGRRVLSDKGPDGKPRWRTIVGIVADVRYRGLQDVRFDFYVPHRQIDDVAKHLVLRADGDPLRLMAQVRSEVRRIDPFAAVEGVTTMEAIVDRAVAPWRLYMVLFAVLGVLALTMSTIGLYAVVRYAVIERWHEFGIRAAMGASARQLAALVMRESVVLLGAGLTIGIGLTLALMRLTTSILFGVAPTDPAVLAGTAGMLAAMALVSAFVPTRTAGRVDPAALLRAR